MTVGGWDTVVRWNATAGMWWWNAWCGSTATELSGWSHSAGRARDEMARRIADVDRARAAPPPGRVGPG